MKPNEKADVAKAAGVAINEIANTVEGMHKAIADPIFSVTAKALGQAVGLDDKLDLDEVVETRSNFGLRANVYRAVRGTSTLTAQGVAWVFGSREQESEATSIHDTQGGATGIAALTTAFGDNLKRAGSSLAPEMTIRVDGQAVPPTPDELAVVFPTATTKMVVSVHGLGSTEYGWSEGSIAFGQLLADEFGFTPVFVRYNTGASISKNGADFALLMQLLFDNWPVDVDQIILVGHSMGGLVIRSACAQVESATRGLDPWTRVVSQIYYIGSPHRGAPLERVSNQIIGVVGKFRRSAPLVPLLNRRSAGIKDLRFGTLLESELGEAGSDPDSNHRDLADHKEIEPLPDTEHHLIVGYKISPSRGWPAELLGDVIVPADSASARSDGVNRSDFAGGQYHAVDGISHIPMMTNPQVYGIIRGEVARYVSENSDSW